MLHAKLLNTMESTKKTIDIKQEGVDANLIAIHEEYLKNAPSINWMEIGVMNHMDTLRVESKIILLQHQVPRVIGKGKALAESKRIIMLDQGLAYYVPYESFTCSELLF